MKFQILKGAIDLFDLSPALNFSLTVDFPKTRFIQPKPKHWSKTFKKIICRMFMLHDFSVTVVCYCSLGDVFDIFYRPKFGD